MTFTPRLLLLLAALTAMPLPAGNPKRKLLGFDETRAMYNAGFQRLRAAARRSGPELTERRKVLEALIEFRDKYVAWAVVERDGAIVAKEKGYQGGGWLGVFAKDNPFSTASEAALSLDPSAEVHLIRVVPVPVTETFAGIALAHELSHLYDRIVRKHIDPAPREFLTREVRSYDYETIAANLLTNGAFSKRLRGELKLMKLGTPSAATDRLGKLVAAGEDGKLRARLESALKLAKSRSTDEDEMRRGFFLIAACFEAVAMAGLDEAQTHDAKMRVIRMFRFGTPWKDPIDPPPENIGKK